LPVIVHAEIAILFGRVAPRHHEHGMTPADEVAN
jgi:hypothetical protein